MINFNSIYPTKNQNNVGVNEDIKINVSADFKLDPRNVIFKIHGVEIIPEIYSVYHGNSTSELNITLYSKRRVKYATDRKYGQENFRYGMRDVYPSMLNYGSRYVVEVIVFGENPSGEREEGREMFAFTTEEGVFKNPSPPEYFYSTMTQAMGNYFPEWSKTRYDKFSNVQQLLNPLGEYLEQTSDFLSKQKSNTFIQTCNLNELSVLHRIELGGDYPIKSIVAESGESYFVQPEIRAIDGITEFDLFAEPENSFQSFYYNKLPTRIDNEREVVQEDIIIENLELGALKKEINYELENPRELYLFISKLNTSIIREGRSVRLLKIRIEGTDQYGEKATEDVVTIKDRPIQTETEWKTIHSVELLHARDEKVEVSIYKIPPIKSVLSDFKREITSEDALEKVFWGMNNRGNGSVLEKRAERGGNVFEILRDSGITDVLQEFHLVDIDNSTPLALIDFTVDPFSNLIYGIDENFLYLFDKREQYTHLAKKLRGNNGSADLSIELEDDQMGLDENGQKEVLFKCVHKNIGKTIVKYRVMLHKPNGEVLYLKPDGTVTSDKSRGIIPVNQNDISVPTRQYSIVLDDFGDYLLELEALYRGGATSLDQQIIRIGKKPALIKYKLERVLDDAIPLSINRFKDQKIKIYDSKNVLNSLILRKDGVMINYDDKILYFIEDYDSVEVES